MVHLTKRYILESRKFRKEIFYSIFIIIIIIFFFGHVAAWGILVPRPGVEPGPPGSESAGPNHWTTREFPEGNILMTISRIATDAMFVQDSLLLGEFCSLVQLPWRNRCHPASISFLPQPLQTPSSALKPKPLGALQEEHAIQWFSALTAPWYPRELDHPQRF